MSEKAIFLDRDDTLIEDPGYISDPEQVKLIDGAATALVEFRRMGYKIVVVSNQSGVARGIVTERKLAKIHSRIKELLAEGDAFLDGIYYCPYHPDGAIPRYRKESDDRKPAPGMLLTASREMDLDLGKSWMIGDSGRDIEAGFRAGCRTILVEPPNRQRQIDGFVHAPDYRAINLKEAVTIIRKYGRSDLKGRTKTEETETNEVRIKMSSSETRTEDLRGGAEKAAADISESQREAVGSEEDESPASGTVTGPEAKSGRDLPRASEVLQVPGSESERAGRQAQQAVDASESAVAESGLQQASVPVRESESLDDDLRLPESDLTEEQETSVESLLAAILDELRGMQRKDLYGEFSVMRLMAGIVQVLVLFCLVIGVWFLMSPKSREGAVAVSLGLAAVLQLMALTFYTMHGRR